MSDPNQQEYDDVPSRGEKPPNPEHVRKAKMHEQRERHPDADALPFKIGDPVMDAAQGRPMLVIGTPDLNVSEWSEKHQYDLTDNYGNEKFGVHPDEPVVACRYVSDVSSDPSKTYTFPQSRLRLIDVHHADEGHRVYDRVAVDVLRRLFLEAIPNGSKHGGLDATDLWNGLGWLAGRAGFDDDAIDEARELADVERRFGSDEDG